MNPPGSGAIAQRRRTYKTRKEAAVHGILDGTTSSKYRGTVLTKTFVVLMAGLFSFVSSEAAIPPPDGGNANGNTAEGTQALFSNTTGNANTAIGARALLNATGDYNVALGDSAGEFLSTGDNNIDIGYNVVGVKGESNTIRIGNTDIIATYIRGISGQTVVGGAAVFVDSNGKLGTMTASTRFSDEIKPMDKASEAILTLKPVTFRYKQEIDSKSIRQFGLIAEEVEKVYPDLIVRDKEGKPYSVRYDQVNAMLLNEFLKEHGKVEKLEASVARQQKQIETLTAGLQKVSAELEASKPASQVVNNNQ